MDAPTAPDNPSVGAAGANSSGTAANHPCGVTSDRANCGNCDRICSNGAACIEGACRPNVCNPTFKLDGLPATKTGRYPVSVAVGDFNGDGKQDLVTANYENSATVSVLLGAGNGTFAANVDYVTSGLPIAIAAGDLNSDGKLDLATADNAGDTVVVLMGNGDGTFGTRTVYPSGYHTYAVAIGDFSGDGINDLATTNSAADTVSVLLGKGHGAFAPKVDYAAGHLPRAMAVGDLNGDGSLDLVTANQSDQAASVLLGARGGTFGTGRDFYPTDGSAWSVALGDLNRDGKLDLVLLLGTWSPSLSILSVMLGDGDGGFAASVDYTLLEGNGPGSLALGDLNGDGKLDIVQENGTSVGVLLGAGDGTFGCSLVYPVNGEGRVSLMLGDLNVDGRVDLAITHSDSDSVSVLLNLPL